MRSEDSPWSKDTQELFQSVGSSEKGLSSNDVIEQRNKYGLNILKGKSETNPFLLFLGQFKSPITLILIAAAVLSLFLNDRTDAIIILIIVLVSSLLGFWQEYGASNAVAKLLKMVQIKVKVSRDGSIIEIPTEDVVPGDVVSLTAGDIIPADSIIISSQNLFVDEAAFTGESYPVEKQTGVLPVETPIAKRLNMLFMGSHVISGKAKALVITTGINTEFGKISNRLRLRPPETEFEHGVRKFGYLLMQVTMVLIVVIFALNVLLHKPILDSLLFSLALAVGLTPQLLPVIITVNLSRGAKEMSKGKVIVKRLAAIENFGSMNILCSDKTGTITQGQVKLNNAVDVNGVESLSVLRYAWLNASLQQGFKNPMDEAIIATCADKNFTASPILDEIPYDFIRKRLSVVTEVEGKRCIITKGAFLPTLDICSQYQKEDGSVQKLSESKKQDLLTEYQKLSEEGFRTLAVCFKESNSNTNLMANDEKEMTFMGFLTFFDPPKDSAIQTIHDLEQLGVKLKIITGDNALVAATLAKQTGIKNPVVLKGGDIHLLSDPALRVQAMKADIFAEVEPNQKEQIIRALQKDGNVVGFMGDGINDAAAIHAADIGLSVDTAVDVAKEAADLVLMDADLKILINGIKEGRKTFANTMKYIFMATSANFGNMFSMAGASLILPFLPLLPTQILLTNILTDVPETAIATDNVDEEYITKPHRMNINFIKKFMIVFGILSSIFDYCTFGVLLLILKSKQQEFQSG